MELNIVNPHEIYKGDFERMVDVQGLEVFEKSQIDQYLDQLGKTLEKSEYSELTEEEKGKIELIKSEVSTLNKWIVVGDNFQKSLKFTRDSQVEWNDEVIHDDVNGDIIKGEYKNTSLNRNLGRVGKETFKPVKE